MKKGICFAVIALMLLSLLPLGAAPRSLETVAEKEANTPITSVFIYGWLKPEYGLNPEFDAFVDDYEEYSVTNVSWFMTDGEIDEPMDEEDVFDDESLSYYFLVELAADPGYEFDEEVEVFFDFEYHAADTVELSEDRLTLYVTSVKYTMNGELADPTYIETAAFEDFIYPEYGAEPFTYLTAVDEGYFMSHMDWYLNTGDTVTKLGKDDCFLNEGTYFFIASIFPEYGYYFDEGSTAIINDDPDIVISAELEPWGSLLITSRDFTVDDPEIIDRIDIIDYVRPVEGDVIDYENYSLNCTDERLGVSGEWYYEKDGDCYWAETFNAVGAVYYLQMHVGVETGCIFADDIEITINGDDSLICSVEQYDRYCVIIADRFILGSEPYSGDINLDGYTDTIDALVALRFALGSIDCGPEYVEICDMDGDGVITTADALIILRIALGIIPQP